MSKPFKFRQFEIIQDKNPHKIGTDSMLLGAWTARQFGDCKVNRILDIGTGTGILTLMMAQSFPEAEITAIEPDLSSFEEAQFNFKNSPFSNRILSIHSRLQNFGAMEKFDLIICNPPYYDGSYASEKENRNRARHTFDLSVAELYETSSELLVYGGIMQVVIPYTELTTHLERAFDNELYLNQVLHSIKSDGSRKRSFLSMGFEDTDPAESELLVKDSQNHYSTEYINLTKNFYLKDLRTL